MMNIASRCSPLSMKTLSATCEQNVSSQLKNFKSDFKVRAINILQLLIRKFKDHVHVTPKTFYPARSYMYNMQENYNSIILTTL